MTKLFETKEECRVFIADHIPIGIKPEKKNAKYAFISPYSSARALNAVVDSLSDVIWDRQQQIIKQSNDHLNSNSK